MTEPELVYPADYTNRFHIVVAPSNTRITFGEQTFTEGQTVYSSAVVMKTSDAKGLAELILKLIERNEALV